MRSMATTLRLSAADLPLVRLALLYHLARPGAELDPATARPAEHGLAEIKAAISDRGDAPVTLALDEAQHRRLLAAMLGCMNELRFYHLNGGAASTVPAFNETARRLFPSMAADPDAALDVAESMLMLRRRLVSGAAGGVEDAPEHARRGRWPFRR